MIDERAVIDPSAKLAEGVSVGPFSVIGADVEIGAGTWIGPHTVINGPTRIGRNNRIYQFASVGEAPQDKKYAGEATLLEIGDDNLIREYCTINRGTPGGGGVTRIGNHNWLMAYTHIAHDCLVGNHTIFSNAASLGGHVRVDDWVILSGFAIVHQFCHIGTHAFCAMGTGVNRDVPPYVMVSGHTAEPHGINKEGLRRRGFSSEAQTAIKQAYKTIYRQGLKLEEALVKLREMAVEHPEVRPMVEFIEGAERGIVR